MQDQIIASHTCFVRHMDVKVLLLNPVYRLNVSDDLKWTTNTCDTIYSGPGQGTLIQYEISNRHCISPPENLMNATI